MTKTQKIAAQPK